MKQSEAYGLDGEAKEERLGVPFDLMRAWTVVWRARKLLVTGTVAAMVLSVVVAVWLLPTMYRSQFIVRLDAVEALPGVVAPKESALAELEQGFVTETVLESWGQFFKFDQSARELRKMVKTSTSPDTGTVAVEVTAESRKAAQLLAQGLAKFGMRGLRLKRRASVADAIERLEKRIGAQRLRFEDARRAHTKLLEEHGIEERGDGDDFTQSTDLQARYNLARSEVKSLQARVTQLRNNAKRAPTMELASQSLTASPAQQGLAAIESELATARASLSEDHPRVRALELRVTSMRNELKKGSRREVAQATMQRSALGSAIRSSLAQAEADLEAAREHLASLGEQQSEAKELRSKYSEVESEAIALLTATRAAERQLTELQGERAQLASALEHPVPGATIVSTPKVPTSADGSHQGRLFAFATPVVVLFLLLGSLWLREFWGLRLMTPGELGYWGRGPVLAASEWPREPLRLEELIADFDDCALHAEGKTLLVPATDSILVETELLAQRLHAEWCELHEQVAEETMVSGIRAVDDSVSVVVLNSQVVGERSMVSSGPPRLEAATRPGKAPSAALTVRGAEGGPIELCRGPGPVSVAAWPAGLDGHGLRRAARLADRVVIVVEAGTLNPFSLMRVRRSVSRATAVGFVLVSASEAVARGEDRIGSAEEFWAHRRTNAVVLG